MGDASMVQAVAALSLAAAIGLPGLAAILVVGLPDRAWRDRVAVLVTSVVLAIVLAFGGVRAVRRVRAIGPVGPDRPALSLGELVPGVAVAYEVDPFGTAFAAIAAISVLLVLLLAIHDRGRGYGRGRDGDRGREGDRGPDGDPRRENDRDDRRVLAWLLGVLAASLSAAFAANLLVLFVSLQVLALASYPLIAHVDDARARHAGYVYLGFAFAGGLLVLAGMRLVYAVAGSLTFEAGGITGLFDADPSLRAGAAILLVLGFAITAGAVPFHTWVVRARVARPPLFGAVFAVVLLKAGLLGFLRVVDGVVGLEPLASLGVAPVLFALGVATVAIAGLLAVPHATLRDRVTYLAIAGNAVPVLALTTAEPVVLSWTLVYLPAHALGLLLAFVGVHLVTVGDRRVVGRIALVAGSWVLVGLSTMAALGAVAMIAVGRPPLDLSLLVLLGLVIGVGVHVLALWPVVGRVRPSPRQLDRVRRADLPAPRAYAIGSTLSVVVRVARRVDAVGTRVALVAIWVVRRPREAIETWDPDAWLPGYHETGLGESGLKLGIEGSIAVLVLVLALVLTVGML